MQGTHRDPDRPATTWAVHRQDDNGNRFIVGTGLSRDEAERLAVEYDAHGHKQFYWVESEPPATPKNH